MHAHGLGRPAAPRYAIRYDLCASPPEQLDLLTHQGVTILCMPQINWQRYRFQRPTARVAGLEVGLTPFHLLCGSGRQEPKAG
jgi:hypothetical protein